MRDEDPPMNWTGMIVPGTDLRGLLDHYGEEVVSKAEGRDIKTTALVVGWDDGNFTQHVMVPTAPEEIKHLSDMLASAALYWYKRWEETQDPDDYDKGEEYIA